MTKSQQAIDEEVKKYNAILKDKTLEERKAMEEEINTALKSFVEKRDELGKTVIAVELSDEQVEFLRTNFKSLIADNFKTVKIALEVAEALGVSFEE